MATGIAQPPIHRPIVTIVAGNRRDPADCEGQASGIAAPSPGMLVDLLESLKKALAGDNEEAKRFVAKAADILDGAVSNRDPTVPSRTARQINARLAPWQARRAIDYVEANLADSIRIEKMAELTRLSHSYFSRAFRSDFGESPYAYVIRRRIEQAKEMMLRTDESLAYIARACGLSDQPHLTRLFRRIVGTSPASWRRQNGFRNRDQASYLAALGAFVDPGSAFSPGVPHHAG